MQATAAPTVLATATFKETDNTLGMIAGVFDEIDEVTGKYVTYGEYITVEFMSNGTVRVVPVSKAN